MPTPMMEPDHGVRARRRQSQPPRAQVPQDGRDQQRKDHRESGAGADLQNQIDRQQRNDGERDRAGGGQHARQVAQPRPDHRDMRLQRVGVDHRGYRVGRVVESVHKLERQRDDQRRAQQHVGPGASQADVAQVSRHVKPDIGQAADESDHYDGPGDPAGHPFLLVQERCSLRKTFNGGCEIGHGKLLGTMECRPAEGCRSHWIARLATDTHAAGKCEVNSSKGGRDVPQKGHCPPSNPLVTLPKLSIHVTNRTYTKD